MSRRRERVFLTLVGFAAVALAFAFAFSAPLWAAADGLQTYTLAVLHLDQGRPRYVWTDEAKCEAFVAEQEARTLYVEDENLPRTRVVLVECQCVSFTEDGQEAEVEVTQ